MSKNQTGSIRSPFKLIVADEHRLPAGIKIPRSGGDYNALLLTLDGGADMVHKGKRHPLRPGRFMWLRSGEFIDVEVHPERAVWGLYIHFSAPKAWTAAQPPIRTWEGEPMAFQLMQYLCECDAKEAARCGPELLQALLRLVSSGPSSRKDPRWKGLPHMVKRAISLARSHPQRTYTLAGLCKELGVSSATLCRQFKDGLGSGPLQVFQQLRLEQAAQRLELGDEQINEVSASLGFANPFYFTRCFTKAYGVSPKAYRLRARKGVFKHWRLVQAQLPNVLAPLLKS